MATPQQAIVLSEGNIFLINLLYLWRAGDVSYKSYLPQLFARLLDPNTSAEYVMKWVWDIRGFVTNASEQLNPEDEPYIGSCAIILDLLDGGLADTMIKISQLTRVLGTRTSYVALEIMEFLILHFDEEHAKKIRAKIIDRGGLDALLPVIATGKPLLRVMALGCVRGLLSCVRRDKNMTAYQVAELIGACCTFHLDGYQQVLNDLQLRTPEAMYLQERIFGDWNHPMDLRFRMQKWFARGQEVALQTCVNVFQLKQSPSRQFALQVLQHRPDIVDSLLMIACEPRPAGNSTSETDCNAVQILLYLMGLPPKVVPGIKVTSSSLSDEDRMEWNAALECIGILSSRPKSIEILIRLRNKVFEEPSSIPRIGLDLDPEILELCKMRATLRVGSLRLLTNFTYLTSPSTRMLLTLLPVSYAACSSIPTIKDCLGDHSPADRLAIQRKRAEGLLEFSMDNYRKDSHSATFVAPEAVLGPTLLFRTFYRLAEAGYGLDQLQRLISLPPNMPTFQGGATYLTHIHQISDSKVIGKLLHMSVNRRVLGRRNFGKEKLRDTGTDREAYAGRNMAATIFASAAELALAVDAFGSHVSNKSLPVIQEHQSSIRQAKQEVVLCLGNAAEAAGRMEQWQMATRFANYAIEFSDAIQMEDAEALGWDIASAREKNVRRLKICSANLK